MNQLKVLQLATLACLGPCLGTAALAQDSSYPYFGLSLGESRAKFDQTGISARFLSGGVSATSLSSDNRDRAYRVFGGYQFNRYVAVEAAFFDLGHFSFRSTTVPAGTLDGNFKLQGGGVDAVGTLPLTDNFSLLGRVGAQYAKTRDSFSGSGAVTVANPTPSERAGNYKVGAGLQYAFGPNFHMRAEADRYRMHDGVGGQANVNVYSVSVVFPFGRAPTRTARAESPAPMTAYVAPAPVPMPAPVAAPAPAVVAAAPMMAAPMPRRVSFNAESLFGFDRTQLRPEGMSALDAFARDISGTSFELIVVEGHTDRLGSAAYNQALSLQRAEVVKAYLVNSGGLAAAKISAAGMGEDKPVTKPGDCQDKLPTAQLRNCLQPDRRVEVDVSGTR